MIMGRCFLGICSLIGVCSMVTLLNQSGGKHRLTVSTVQVKTSQSSYTPADKHLSLSSSTPEQHDNSNDSHHPKPIFVLHIGPHKTGTTTIQAALGNDAILLKSDNYTFLGTFHPRSTEGEFVRPGIEAFDNEHSRVIFQDIRQQYQKEPSNLIMSDEFLAFWTRRNENNTKFFHLLKQELQGWHIHVVVDYRRYHEWLVSLYNQRFKHKKKQRSFVRWYRTSSDPKANRSYGNDCKQVYFAMKKLFDSVSILNVHSPENLMTDFYCNTIPNATNACKRSKIQNEATRANPSVPLWPGTIASIAIQRNLTNGIEVNDTQILEQPITKFANEINYTLPLSCLSRKEIRDILQKTIAYEKTLVPDFFFSEFGKKVLLEEFETAVKDKKFCSVDTNKVLQDARWRRFLGEYSIQ